MKSLWLLLAIACTSLAAEEVSLAVPRFPPAELPEATDPLHGRFQEAWRKYEECARRVENSVIQFLDKEFNKAADRGSLDTADMWNQKKKVFIETGRVAVEAPSKPKASARKTQKTDQAENIFEYLETAQQEIDEAKKGLRVDYESLVREYTKARNLERAKQVREQALALGITQDGPAGRPREGDAKPRRKIALTGVAPRSKDVFNGWWGVDKLPGKWKTPCRIVVNKQVCESFLFAHAPSKVVFDLPTGAKRFTATAVCPAGIPPGGNPDFVGDWICAVAVDGRQVFRERLGNRELAIEVEIPPGAKTLTLIGDPNGRNNWDCVVWALPILEID